MLNSTHRSNNKTWRSLTRGRTSPRSSIWEKDAPAQGMVEFALVLPVLLLIIFGIIAFGHFFFNYSLVVAASRDAARFGAAVGLTENSLPRYRDCNQIREAAVQSGKLAGVDGTDATVTISYDQGPKLDGTTVVYQAADPLTGVMGPVGCPIDGIGPGFIDLGDRIAVTVTVNYQPIVPLVPISDMPMTATTRRTIMLGMPVGEVPIAEQSECTGTLTRIVGPLNSWDNTLMGTKSLVGQEMEFLYEAIADDPDATAQGHIYFYVDDVLYATPTCDANAPYNTCKLTFNTITPLNASPVKPHVLRAKYDPQGYSTGTPCYDPSKAEPIRHYVLPGETTLTILSIEPSPSIVGEAVTVEVEVRPVAPAGGTPFGKVYVEEKFGAKCEIMLDEFEPGVARGKCSVDTGNPLILDTAGTTTIAATYDPPGLVTENPNYNSSSAAAEHQVGTVPDPSPIDKCPVFVTGIDLNTNGQNMYMSIKNENEFIPVPVASVTVNWPSTDPLVSPSSINFDTHEVWISPAYPAPPAGPPLTVAANYTIQPLVTTNLWMAFWDTLPPGDYSVTVTFGTPNPPITCGPITAWGKK